MARSSSAATFVAAFLFCLITEQSFAQDKRIIRIAQIKIDSAQLDAYNSLLKEEVEAAVRIEPGVLMLYAVSDKADPTNVVTFEIYADSAAYKSHIKTPHFQKYKTGTLHMVKALKLIDVSPIAMPEKALQRNGDRKLRKH